MSPARELRSHPGPWEAYRRARGALKPLRRAKRTTENRLSRFLAEFPTFWGKVGA
jgi:hypothetical protein